MNRLRRLLRRPGAGWLAASVCLTVAAVAMLGRGGEGPAPTRSVLLATEPVPPGARIGEKSVAEAFAHAEVPHDVSLDGLVTAGSDVVGRTVASGLRPGEPVTLGSLADRHDVSPAPLGPGERSISVTVATPAAGVWPGALVDVVASARDGVAPTRVVVRAAEVLALDRDEAVGVAASVSLRVEAAGALEIAEAVGAGRDLHLLVRSAADATRLGDPP